MSTPLLVAVPPAREHNWRTHAACAEHPNPELWFPARGVESHEAKAICATCPVQADCLEEAVQRNEPIGIWGGVSERARRKIRKARREAQAGPPGAFRPVPGGLPCAVRSGTAPALSTAGRAAHHP